MSNYIQLINNFEKLKLSTFKENIDNVIDQLNKREMDFVESLLNLTNAELMLRKERAEYACVRTANFPFLKTFDDFDFSFQPNINEAQIRDFVNFRFIEKKENILFLGSSGVGKSHLASSIGIECAKNRYSAYFITCHDLLDNLRKAHLENRLETRLKHYRKYKLLIIDEIGYLPIDHNAASMFFQLINMRYERNSTIITTNKPFSKWGEVFGDSTIANAILDRLLHHSHIIKITGNSYRTKDKLDIDRRKN
ncbi:IS21-like element helper ATPase IstB [Mycoplasmatota bacterium zrk1]